MSIISILELAGVAHLPKAKQLIESVILFEGYKEAQVEFGSVAGEQQAKTTIDQFRDLVNRNQVQGNERNIDYWRKQGWDQFSAFVREKSQDKSKRQEKHSRAEGRSVTIHEDSNWLVVVPIDKDASCFHGKNTDWCTTKPYRNYFEQYFYKDGFTLIYFLKLDTGDKWAIAAHPKIEKMGMFDRNDKEITAEQFRQQTGFNPEEFRQKVLKSEQIQDLSSKQRQLYTDATNRINQRLPSITQKDTTLERDLWFIKDGDLIIDYCVKIGQRWEKAERFLAGDPQFAYTYSKRVIKDRWLEAEPAIMKDANTATWYAIDILHDRWPEAEPAIMKDATSAVEYAKSVIGGRWPEAEPAIMKARRKDVLMDYIINVLKIRWPKAEPVILKAGPYLLISYAKNVIKGRWPEAEPAIMKDASAAVYYATEVIGGRWSEAEDIIMKKPDVWKKYQQMFA